MTKEKSKKNPKRYSCRICDNSRSNKIFWIKEMMFGISEEFEYFECSSCGCLQISQIPHQMSKYYPESYYSFFESPKISSHSVKKYLSTLRDRYCLMKKSFFGRILNNSFPNETMRLIGLTNISFESRVLDVGCGSGLLLSNLKNAGFNNVLGIDPFISKSISYPDGLEIKKLSIQEVSGRWDLIMYHHVFEHVAEPLQQLKVISKLLSTDGICLIRIPTVSSFAWQHYGVNWIQLDPPRHHFLFSNNSLKILCKKAGLQIEKIIYDSNEFQFWGSVQAENGIYLENERSYLKNKSKSNFDEKQIAEFRRKAVDLNKLQLGDQAAYFIKKIQ